MKLLIYTPDNQCVEVTGQIDTIRASDKITCTGLGTTELQVRLSKEAPHLTYAEQMLAMKANDKLAAVLSYRYRTRASLLESKNIVDRFCARSRAVNGWDIMGANWYDYSTTTPNLGE